jgi:hypothetical protein
MSDNYDDIIKQVLAAKGKPLPVPTPEFSDQDMLMPYPVHTAKVPPDRLPDTPWRMDIPPITGNETTPPVVSNEAAQDKLRQAKMFELMRQTGELASKPNFDPAAMQTLIDQSKALANASPAVAQGRRLREVKENTPIDADVMMKAIEERQALGRSR